MYVAHIKIDAHLLLRWNCAARPIV